MKHIQLKKVRRDLHRIPELEFELYKTRDYVKAQLEDMGYQTFSTAKTGIIAFKEGQSKEAIAFRSDMDALPVTELTQVSYKSTHPGHMHACGHDGHMTMLLGFADYLKDRTDLKKSVVLIFQPAEETPGGAEIIIKEGLFQTFDIKMIFGIHLYPGLDEGLYGLTDGPMMSRNGEFDVMITGISAHGAQPHEGKDSILAASTLISAYHDIVSRRLDPLDPGVVTIGTVHGGEARNVIAHRVKMSGTMRAFSDDVYQTIKKEMKAINKGIEHMYHVKVNHSVHDDYPVTYNDHALFETLKASLKKEEYDILKPIMFAEDFSFYQQVVPGMFVMLGTRNKDKGFTHPLHSSYFNFDEEVLQKGVDLYIKLALLYQVL